MKNIKVRLIDLDKLIFELSDDAKKHDQFCLKEAEEYTDLSYKIKGYFDKKVDEKIQKEKTNILNEYRSSFEFKYEYLTPIEKLKIDNTKLQEQLTHKNTAIKNAIDEERNKILKENNQKIIELKEKSSNDISKLNQDILNLKEKSSNDIYKLNEDIFLLKGKNSILNANKEVAEKNIELILNKEFFLKLKKQEEELLSNFEKEKEAIEKQHEIAIKSRNSRNIKQIGNELEKWCEQEYNDHFSLAYDDCIFEPTNKIIDGKKPDYSFKVFNDKTLITSVILEMKSESDTSDDKNRNKNSKFLDKLEKDRENNKAEYGLLVTELEWDDIFVIKKVNNQQFKNIYIVRPQYFLTFLSLVRSFALKKKEIINQNIDFQAKKDILEQFEDMKDNILDNSIKNLEKDAQSILTIATKIGTEAAKIEELSKKIIDTHVYKITNKIQKFNIEKILKKIEKVSNE